MNVNEVIKVKKFSKATVQYLRNNINYDLRLLNEKYGLTFSIGNISFSENEFNTKLTVATPAKMEAKEKEASSLGRIKYEGEVYNIYEHSTRSPRYPYKGENVKTGKKYKFSQSVYTKYLIKEAVTA